MKQTRGRTMQPSKPMVIPVEDPIIHTLERPVCDDPTCICAQAEYELLRRETQPRPRKRRRTLIELRSVPMAGSPHGVRPFSHGSRQER